MLTVVLVVFGVVMIFSASYYKSISDAGDPYLYLKRQLMWAAIGFVGMWILSKIDYHIWGGLYKIIPLLCVGLLALIFTPLGQEAGGAVRWVGVGPITIMPGEVAKVGLIIFVSGYFARYPKRAMDFWKGSRAGSGGDGRVCRSHHDAAQHVHSLYHRLSSPGGMLLVAGARWSHLGILVGGAAVGRRGLYLYGSRRLPLFAYHQLSRSLCRSAWERLSG